MHKSIIKKVFLAGLLISVLLIFAGIAAACRSNTSSVPDQIVLSWTGAPTDTQSITWYTEEPSEGFVQYVKDANYKGSWIFSEKRMIKAKRKTISKAHYYRYEADIDSLAPGTAYRYRVGNMGNWSETEVFHTARAGADNFSFLYMGDVQYETRKEDYEAWGELLNGAYKNHPEIAFGIIGGDMVDSSGSLKDWNAFLNQAASVFSHIPLMPVPGNHDTSALPGTYLNMFALPQNGTKDFKEEFYSFDYGQCHIVALNSCIFAPEREKMLGHERWLSFVADADQWIKEDLSSSKAKWKIVVMHHPAYEIVDDNKIFDLIKANWVPFFTEEKVDLVMSGHQHIYMRTRPIDGVTYVMANSGKKRSNYYNGSNAPAYAAYINSQDSTYQIIRINGDKLALSVFDEAGRQIDFWQTAKKHR